ncbi:hypothetical protein ACT0GK_003209 [Vibrio parahaemolyticus]
MKRLRKKRKTPKNFQLAINSPDGSLHALKVLYQESRDVYESSIKSLISSPISFQFFCFQNSAFETNLHKTKYIVTSRDARQIIFLILEVFKKSPSYLKAHLKYKSDIERYILLSEFDKALNLLDQHKGKFGLSYWYFENVFGILSKQGRKTEAFEIYSRYSKFLTEVESRDLNLLLERSSKSVSSERFDFIIDSLIDSFDSKSIDRNILKFLFNFNASNEYDIKSVLEFSLKLNLPDVYNIISRALSYLSVHGGNHKKDIYDFVSISSLVNINEKEFYKIYDKEHVSHNYIYCLNEYISGSNETSLELSKDRINRNPRNNIDFDILSKSSYLLDERPKEYNIINEFLCSCVSFLSSRKFEDLEKSVKITQQFNSMNCLQYVNILRTKETDSFLSKKSSNIKRFLYLLSIIEGTDCFQTELDSYIKGLRELNKIDIPYYRKNKWDNDTHFERKEYVKYVENILEFNSYPPHMMNEIIEKSIYSKCELGRLDQVVKDIVCLYVHNRVILKPDFISRIYDLYKFDLDKGSEITLVFNLILYQSKKINLQRLALFCDSFLKVNSIPSFEVYSPIDKIGKFILTDVVTLDVIKKQRIKYQLDPLIVRANILKNAGKISELSDLNKREIDRLIREYARKLSLVSVGNGKVYINEDYLTNEMYQVLFDEYTLVEQSAEAEKDILDNLSIESAETKTHELAIDFLFKARDVYTVNDKFGIENSLNTHFRHNSIVPTLRFPLNKSGLDCSLLSGVYTDNKLLEDRFKRSVKTQPYNEIQNCAKLLSENIDKELNFLKDKYLHVDLNDIQDKDMLFRYDISKEDIFKLVSLVNAGTTYDEILTWSMNLFNRKTNLLLDVGRKYIKNSLCSVMLKELNQFEKRLEKYIDSDDVIFDIISEAEVGIVNTCNEVSEWFNFIGQASEDFQICTPIDEAYNFIVKTNPSKNITHNINIKENYLLKGKYLFNMINVFIILLQNAAKSNINNTHVEIDIKKESNNKIFISVVNYYDVIDLEKILEISNNIQNNDEFLKGALQNTGSGIYKVCRLMYIDMCNVEGLSIDVEENENKISISWIMKTGFEVEI